MAISLKDPDEVSEEIQGRVRGIVQTAEDVLYSDAFNNPKSGYAKYFDVDSLVDWYIIHELVCMFDASSFFTSAYFHYDPVDEKIHMGPCWDYDTAMRRNVSDLELKRINSWYARLWEDEAFSELVRQRWHKIASKVQESVQAIQEMAFAIEISANYNFQRWEVLGTYYDGIDEWEDLKTYTEQVVFF